jgi:cytochrome c oxidase cbb3-type subunit 3
MSNGNSEPVSKTPRRPVWLVAVGLIVLAALAGGGYALHRLQQAQLGARLLATMPDDVDKHPDLVRYADAEARPLFAKNCAGCHGLDLKGRGIGAPDLTDSIWLYGSGVFHIERTITYGVRSGQKKANDITEMPAFGQRGQLTDTDIKNVVQYLLQLNHRPYNDQAAFLGKQVYQTKGLCFDCHAPDAKGIIDYGAPDLTANVWDFGGSPGDLYDSIYYGRHGIMPAWIGRLTPEQIRALAVYVDTASKR